MSCMIKWAQKNEPQTSKKAVRGQKHPSEAKKGHEGIDLVKKVFNKSSSTTSNSWELVSNYKSFQDYFDCWNSKH